MHLTSSPLAFPYYVLACRVALPPSQLALYFKENLTVHALLISHLGEVVVRWRVCASPSNNHAVSIASQCGDDFAIDRLATRIRRPHVCSPYLSWHHAEQGRGRASAEKYLHTPHQYRHLTLPRDSVHHNLTITAVLPTNDEPNGYSIVLRYVGCDVRFGL